MFSCPLTQKLVYYHIEILRQLRETSAMKKLMVIDGGFSKAYHTTTGIAGFTLVYHSKGLVLVQHEPFSSTEEAIREGTDIVSTTQLVELSQNHMRVRDTDMGRELQRQIDELRELLYAYRHGLIKTKQ